MPLLLLLGRIAGRRAAPSVACGHHRRCRPLSTSQTPPPPPHQHPQHPQHPQHHPDQHCSPLPRSGHFHLDPFTPADYAERRRCLFAEFQRHVATADDSGRQFADFDRHLLLIPSAQQQFMAHHVPYTLRQNSYLRYLTGHLGADAMLVLACDGSGGGGGGSDFDTAALLVHRQSETERLWDGQDVSPEEAAQRAGLSGGGGGGGCGRYTEDPDTGKFLEDQMARAKGKLALWYNYKEPANPNLDRSLVLAAVKRRGPQAVANVEPLIDRLRWRKSPKEAAVMRRAALIGAAAMSAAMSATGPGINEAAIWAVLDFECRRMGAERLAYPPVIGGGPRSTIIHYMKNNQPVQPPHLILADSGAEVHGYVSDITRTWPASGSFTQPQRIAYEIVAHLLAECRQFCSGGGGGGGGGVSLDDVHLHMAQRLQAHLSQAGVLSPAGSALSPHALCQALCPHHVSHYLGMDVHDTPSISRSEPLQPGVAFPLEPGLYISADCPLVTAEFRGLGGIRLEDDFLVDERGQPELLTGDAALAVDEVEQLAGPSSSYVARLP